MADDIVTRLRHIYMEHDDLQVLAELAADEIERLRAHIEQLTSNHPLRDEYTFTPQDSTVWIPESNNEDHHRA